MKYIKITLLAIMIVSIVLFINAIVKYSNLKKINEEFNEQYIMYNNFMDDIEIFDNLNNNYSLLISNNDSLESEKIELENRIINLNSELNEYNSKIKGISNIK